MLRRRACLEYFQRFGKGFEELFVLVLFFGVDCGLCSLLVLGLGLVVLRETGWLLEGLVLSGSVRG